jgi:hypothetical protein
MATKLTVASFVNHAKQMSYDDTPDYGREEIPKSRLDALLKPSVRNLSERNAPGYLRNDISMRHLLMH